MDYKQLLTLEEDRLIEDWNQTHARALEEIAETGESRLLADCLAYALAYTSRQANPLGDVIYQAEVLSSTVGRVSEAVRAEVYAYFVELVPHLSPNDLAFCYLDWAEVTTDEAAKNSFLEKCLQAAEQIDNAYYRAQVRLAAASMVEGEMQTQLLEQAWADTLAITDTWGRVQIAMQQIDQHPEALKIAEESVVNIEDAFWRVRGLAVMAPHVSGEERAAMMDEAIRLAESIPAPRSRALAYALILKHVDGDDKTRLFQGFRETFAAIKVEYPIATLMGNVGGLIPVEMRRELLPRLWAIENPWYRLRSLAGIMSEVDDLPRYRHDIAIYLQTFQTGGLREQVLAMCGNGRLFSPNVWGEDAYELAVQHIVGVCSARMG